MRARSLTSSVRGLGVATVMALSACSDDESLGPICAPLVDRALQIAVRDSVTGAAIAQGAAGVAIANGYRDTLTALHPGDTLWLASQRSTAGRFDIRIDRPGYAVWTARDVEVAGGICGVQTWTRLQARLQPLD